MRIIAIILILLTILLTTSTTLKSQTNVGGPYFTNTVWNLAGSPYILTADVQVADGVTLTIEPGVEINYNANYELLVKGSISVLGTNALPIIFNGNYTDNSEWEKAMIIFKSTDLSNSQIVHSIFNGPKRSLQLADEMEMFEDLIKNSDTLYTSNLLFINTEIKTKGIATSAKLIIENSNIENTILLGYPPASEPIELINSTITNSIFEIGPYNYGIIINQSTVANSDFRIGCCGANLNVLNSTITNSPLGESLWGSSPRGPITILNSELNNSPINLPRGEVNIEGSIINYNSTTGIILGHGEVICSKITGNNTGTAIQKHNPWNTGTFPTNSLTITSTTITNNSVGIDILSTDFATINNTNIISNSNYNLKNYTINNINAKNNWWGTTSTSIIDNKIFDYFDDINYSEVDYTNHLASSYDNTVCNPLITSIDYVQQISKFTLYPNPTTGPINIDLEERLTNLKTTLTNSLGQVIVTKEYLSTDFIRLDIDEPKGIYFLQLQTENGAIITKKILKE